MASLSYLKESENHAAAAAASASASTADALYPASNAVTTPPALPWRSTALASQWIEVDLGSAQAIDLIAIVGHNLSSTATINVRAGATAAPTTLISAMTWRDRTAYVGLSATASHRYWRIEISDAANTSPYVQVGYIVLGNRTVLGTKFALGWERTHRTVTRRSRTELHVPLVGTLLQQAATLRLTFDSQRVAESAEADAVRDWLLSFDRDKRPLFLIPNDDLYQGYWGRWATDVQEIFPFDQVVDFAPMLFEEDNVGLRVDA